MDLIILIVQTALFLAIGFVVVFVILFVKYFFQFHKEIKQEIIQQVILLTVDEVEHNGLKVFLLYEQKAESKFLTQSKSLLDLSKFIVENFKGKTVILREGNEEPRIINIPGEI